MYIHKSLKNFLNENFFEQHNNTADIDNKFNEIQTDILPQRIIKDLKKALENIGAFLEKEPIMTILDSNNPSEYYLIPFISKLNSTPILFKIKYDDYFIYLKINNPEEIKTLFIIDYKNIKELPEIIIKYIDSKNKLPSLSKFFISLNNNSEIKYTKDWLINAAINLITTISLNTPTLFANNAYIISLTYDFFELYDINTHNYFKNINIMIEKNLKYILDDFSENITEDNLYLCDKFANSFKFIKEIILPSQICVGYIDKIISLLNKYYTDFIDKLPDTETKYHTLIQFFDNIVYNLENIKIHFTNTTKSI